MSTQRLDDDVDLGFYQVDAIPVGDESEVDEEASSSVPDEPMLTLTSDEAEAWRASQADKIAPRPILFATTEAMGSDAEFTVQVIGDSALTLSTRNEFRKAYPPSRGWVRAMSKIIKGEHSKALAKALWAQRLEELGDKITKSSFMEKMMLAPEESELAPLRKAEGARGGKVIGHTHSGKPIYASKTAHQNFTSKDHSDAASLHFGNEEFHYQAAQYAKRNRSQAFADRDDRKIAHHEAQAKLHGELAIHHQKKASAKPDKNKARERRIKSHMEARARFKKKAKKSEDVPSWMKSGHKDILHGGKADRKKPSDFNATSLRSGASHEREHTNNKQVAQEIAMDHLTEDPAYYKKLKNAGVKSEAPSWMKSYVGFDKLKGKLKGKVSDPGAVAAAIGRKKYGKKKFQEHAKEGTKMRKEKPLKKSLRYLGLYEFNLAGTNKVPMLEKEELRDYTKLFVETATRECARDQRYTQQDAYWKANPSPKLSGGPGSWGDVEQATVAAQVPDFTYKPDYVGLADGVWKLFVLYLVKNKLLVKARKDFALNKDALMEWVKATDLQGC